MKRRSQNRLAGQETGRTLLNILPRQAEGLRPLGSPLVPSEDGKTIQQGAAADMDKRRH
jgi:hypothetical protein